MQPCEPANNRCSCTERLPGSRRITSTIAAPPTNCPRQHFTRRCLCIIMRVVARLYPRACEQRLFCFCYLSPAELRGMAGHERCIAPVKREIADAVPAGSVPARWGCSSHFLASRQYSRAIPMTTVVVVFQLSASRVRYRCMVCQILAGGLVKRQRHPRCAAAPPLFARSASSSSCRDRYGYPANDALQQPASRLITGVLPWRRAAPVGINILLLNN